MTLSEKKKTKKWERGGGMVPEGGFSRSDRITPQKEGQQLKGVGGEFSNVAWNRNVTREGG